MRYLEINEVIYLHTRLIAQSGGATGIRDSAGLESAVAQPQMTIFDQELYPTLAEKAAILGFILIANHPFMDGNKRIGQISMEAFLMFNDFEIDASIDEQEAVILKVAAGEMSKEDFSFWVKTRIKPL